MFHSCLAQEKAAQRHYYQSHSKEYLFDYYQAYPANIWFSRLLLLQNRERPP